MIKKYLQFINEGVDVPDLKSWDDLNKIEGFNYNPRHLTDFEKELLDKYCKNIEDKFPINKEQVKEILLDLDLIDNLKINITDILIRIVDGKESGITDFNFRKEVLGEIDRPGIGTLISMKRWYDKFIGTIRPAHSIIIEKDPKDKFNHEKVREYLFMVKETFEEMCECEIEIDEGGQYSIQFRIKYPETTI